MAFILEVQFSFYNFGFLLLCETMRQLVHSLSHFI